MSATINQLDVQRLGLGGRRVAFFYGESAIPPENAPFIAEGIASMSYKNRPTGIPKVCARILELADQYKGKKGLIHTTYDLVPQLKKYLTGPRFMWHTQDQDNKEEVFKQYKASSEDVVLVACGMAEGIDLPGDYCRWAVITNVMYPSLQDALNAKQAREEPLYYNWRTIRTIAQQSRRHVRGPTDYGVTHILATEFKELHRRAAHMWPDYIKIDWRY